jgi:hypothetical protein
MRTIDDLVPVRPPAGDPHCFVRQETLAAYLARVDYASSSTLRRCRRAGPARADAPFEDDGSQRLAQALHALVLEPARFARDYLVLDRDAPPGQDEADDADALERIWLSGAEFAALASARDAIRAYPRAPLAAWIDAGMNEKSIYWTDGAGRRWKARPDCYAGDIVLELKTTGDVRPRAFARTRRRFGYDLQAAHYADAIERMSGRRPRFAFVAVELAAPHYVWLHELSRADLARAAAELEGARASLAAWRAAPGGAPAPH